MSSIFHLYQLQKIDSSLMANTTRLESIETSLSIDTTVKSLKNDSEKLIEELNVLKIEMSRIEDNLLNRRNKLEQSESSLYSGTIKNHKELQDLQKEIAFIQSNIADLEDEQLELMVKIESQEEALSLSLDRLKAAELDHLNNNALLIEEKQELLTNHQHLFKERELVVSQVGDDLLSLYDALRSKKKGIAVSKIEDQMCSVCGSTLTPAECQSAKSRIDIISCPTCGRILYAD